MVKRITKELKELRKEHKNYCSIKRKIIGTCYTWDFVGKLLLGSAIGSYLSALPLAVTQGLTIFSMIGFILDYSAKMTHLRSTKFNKSEKYKQALGRKR